MPKNLKRGHSGSLNVFTNRKLQKNARDIIRKFSTKSCIVPKKHRGGHFGLASTFGTIKTFVVLCENRTQDLRLLRKLDEQMNKRV